MFLNIDLFDMIARCTCRITKVLYFENNKESKKRFYFTFLLSLLKYK